MAPVITRPPSADFSSEDDSIDTKIPLGQYLFLRICQVNPLLRSIFGIPGDFNLSLLEHLYADDVASKVEFVGFCNELNAAYAADGYARTMRNICVLITTYGVGELSAANGIAGAFAEYAPVLHIVGTTSTQQAEQARTAGARDVRNIHHLLQSKDALKLPDHDVYKTIVDSFSVASESLGRDMEANLEKIDKVLTRVFREKRPGYLFIPSDIPDVMVSTRRLTQTLRMDELNNESLLADVSARILSKLYASQRPAIVGDALADRFGAKEQLTRLVDQMPANFVKLFTTTLGRNIDESLPNYVGVYSGRLTESKTVKAAYEQETDFLLTLGYCNDEINSGAYSTDVSQISDLVEVHPDYVWIDNGYVHVKDAQTERRAFSIVDLIGRLADDFDAAKLIHNDGRNHVPRKAAAEQRSAGEPVAEQVITQRQLLDFFDAYLRPNDILVVETCSFIFGVAGLNLPKGVTVVAQNMYGSIGYALPATFGVCRAQRDLHSNRRVVLVQGDGAAQMTVQEWSTYLRYEIVAPEIFLLNNEGYTVERLIKGPTRPYNDIQATWDWTGIFALFGDKHGHRHESLKVRTAAELDQLKQRKRSNKITMFELRLPKFDVPDRFLALMGKKQL